jgi:tetratricopeptide (TPR) repeat protein
VKWLEWLHKKTSGKSEQGELSQTIQALVSEGHACLTRGDYEPARKLFLKLLDFREHLKNTILLEYALFAIDSTWSENEQYAEATMFFSEHIGRYPRDLAAYCCRGGAFWYAGELERAISDYSHVLKHQPDHVVALSGRGQVYAEAGKFAGALQDLDEALKVLKERPAADTYRKTLHSLIEPFIHRGRGVALAALGSHAAALDELNRSLDQGPENAWAYYSRAEFHDAAGDRERANADYLQALEKKGPKLNPIRRERARAWLKI